jgi:hypothetical protein
MTNPRRKETRLLRRMAYLRAILRAADDARIAVAANELIAETQNSLVSLETDRAHHAMH